MTQQAQSYYNPETGLWEMYVPGLPGNTPFATRQATGTPPPPPSGPTPSAPKSPSPLELNDRYAGGEMSLSGDPALIEYRNNLVSDTRAKVQSGAMSPEQAVAILDKMGNIGTPGTSETSWIVESWRNGTNQMSTYDRTKYPPWSSKFTNPPPPGGAPPPAAPQGGGPTPPGGGPPPTGGSPPIPTKPHV